MSRSDAPALMSCAVAGTGAGCACAGLAFFGLSSPVAMRGLYSALLARLVCEIFVESPVPGSPPPGEPAAWADAAVAPPQIRPTLTRIRIAVDVMFLTLHVLK